MAEFALVAEYALRALDLGSPLEECQFLSGGLMNITVRAVADRKHYAVRMRSHASPVSTQLFAAERWTGTIADAAGLTTPRLYGVTEVQIGAGWSVAVFDAVTGIRFDHLAQDCPGLAVEFARLWGAEMALLHSVPCMTFGTLLNNQGTDSVYFVCDLLSLEMKPLKRLDPELAIRFGNMVTALATIPEIANRRPRYVHGDVHGRNLLVTKEGTLVWLDWEACRRRLPEFDFAQLPYTTWRADKTMMQAMVSGYREAARQAVLAPPLLHAAQIYWHVRFGLFLTNCRIYDHAYFGLPFEHFKIAGELLASGPADWATALCAGGATA